MADRAKDNAYLDEMIDGSFPASDPPSYSGTTAGAPMHRAGAEVRPARILGTGKRLIGVAVAAIAVLGAALAFLLRPRRRNRKRGRRRR
jgi:hypothetical protein